MLYPHDDILLADSTRNRAVLLSERTQLIVIKTLESAEFQSAWQETTDAEWDDLDNAIGQAEYEVLTEEVTGVNVRTRLARRGATQSIAAGTPTAITWNDGQYDPSFPTHLIPLTGAITITGFLLVTAAVATQLTLTILRNGDTEIAKQSFFNAATTQRMTLTALDQTGDDDDYYELIVLTNQASTVSATENAYLRTHGLY